MISLRPQNTKHLNEFRLFQNYDDDINVEESMEVSYDVHKNFSPPSELCQLPVDVRVEEKDKGDYITRKDITGRSDLSGNIKGRRFFDRTASPEESYKVSLPYSKRNNLVKSNLHARLNC